MKKLLSCFLVALLLLSLGITAHADATDSVFSSFVDVSGQIGETIGSDGYHSGHQTRIVHTTHGDYIAILTERLKDDDKNIQLNEFSLIKVQNGKATLLYQDYQSYCTSSINIFQDDNGEVYASSIVSNKYNSDSSEESVSISIWHIDAKTDFVNGYKTTIRVNEPASYGYAQPVIDTKQGKIYAILSRGNGDKDGYLHWFIFDLKTMSWEPNEYKLECPERWRYMYHYLFADGKGGLYIVTERNALAEHLGYPEIPDNPKWPADYVWDALAYYYIPNMYDDSEWYFQYIEEPDYSRIKDLDGDGKYTSMEERLTNQYPTVVNNHQGDAYLDSKGLLHVLYTVGYNQCAYDRSVCFESLMYHSTYDLSNPKQPKLLSKEQLFFEYPPAENVNYAYEFRMTEGADGTLFIVCGDEDETAENATALQLYELTPKAEGGYVYTKRGQSEKGFTTWGLGLTNLRSNSTTDGTAAVLVKYKGTDKMAVTTVTLPTASDLGLAINSVNFPDDTFRAYVSSVLDSDRNGYLSDAEIAQIARLDVSNKGIASLKGIEYFTALQYLDCSYNQLTELDVSRNTLLATLICNNNQLTSLDLSATKVTESKTDSNVYAITTDETKKNTFDLKNLPGSFDVTRATNWKGGTVNGTTLTLDNGAASVTYDYDCGLGVTTTFTLTLTNPLDKLVITQQPTTISVKEGEDATFTVAVSGGKEPYTYQWQKLGKDNEWANVGSSRVIGQSTLTLSAVTKNDNESQYRCVITDAAGNTVTSDAATLSVSFELPTTGDESQPILWAMMVMLAGAALIMMKRRQDA